MHCHKSVNARRALQNGINIGPGRLVMIEMVVKTFGLGFEGLNEGVDICFALGAVDAALVQGLLQTIAKGVGLALDSIQQARHFAIRDAIWLPRDLCAGTGKYRQQHDEATSK
jgi:hypothetical protein